ncbi:hypothetical protein BJX61DRAFT_519822 [Aspergillus egyptiacus]|nr:hypothetical protein BJX61DRAFT_519822 [Aspergillus egyptiacus]
MTDWSFIDLSDPPPLPTWSSDESFLAGTVQLVIGLVVHQLQSNGMHPNSRLSSRNLTDVLCSWQSYHHRDHNHRLPPVPRSTSYGYGELAPVGRMPMSPSRTQHPASSAPLLRPNLILHAHDPRYRANECNAFSNLALLAVNILIAGSQYPSLTEPHVVAGTGIIYVFGLR